MHHPRHAGLVLGAVLGPGADDAGVGDDAIADREAVDTYLDALQRQAAVVADQLGEAHFARLAIGGGTPTLASPAKLAKLLHTLLGDGFAAHRIGVVLSAELGECRIEVLHGDRHMVQVVREHRLGPSLFEVDQCPIRNGEVAEPRPNVEIRFPDTVIVGSAGRYQPEIGGEAGEVVL